MKPDELRKLAEHHLQEARFAADEATRATSPEETLDALDKAEQHATWHRGLLALADRINTPGFP